ncbi:MAG: hypothetical protein K2H53_06900 [Clostridia bacterium]|nr:hypothetical protein [Clostridia bacterium]
MVVLITAYVNYKKEKDKKPAEDNKSDAGSRNGESIYTGDSGDRNISVISGGGDVTINTDQTPSENEGKKHSNKARNALGEIRLSEISTSLFAEDNRLKTEQIRITIFLIEFLLQSIIQVNTTTTSAVLLI